VADPRDRTFVDARQAQRFHQFIDPTSAHSLDIDLLDRREQRLFGLPARFEQAGEIAALTEFGDFGGTWPTRVCQARSRYPLRYVVRSSLRSYRSAPIRRLTSICMSRAHITRTASRKKSGSSPAPVWRTYARIASLGSAIPASLSRRACGSCPLGACATLSFSALWLFA